jgi:aryl-alcohol dehydrogenase-like predicted oxidoreductase
LSVLTDLIREGKVRAIGCSTFPAELIVEAHWAAERRGLERFRCEQPPYSLFARGIEAGVLPVCERYGMGVIAWSPLAGGWLTGKYRHGQEIDMTSGRASRIPQRFDPTLPANQHKLDLVDRLEAVAASAGVPLRHLALAFVVSHPAVTAAIIGPRTMDQLQDLIAGCDVTLDDDTLDRLDEIVPPGVTMNPADAGWQSESLTLASRRRRPLDERAAG